MVNTMSSERYYYRIEYYNKDHSFKKYEIVFDTEESIDSMIDAYGTYIHVYKYNKNENDLIRRRIW